MSFKVPPTLVYFHSNPVFAVTIVCAIVVALIAALLAALRAGYQAAFFPAARAVPLAVRYAMHSPDTAAFAASCHRCGQVRIQIDTPALTQTAFVSVARVDAGEQRHGSVLVRGLPCGARLPFVADVVQHDDGSDGLLRAPQLRGVVRTLPCAGAAATVRIAFGSCISLLNGGMRLDVVFGWLQSLGLDAFLMLGDLVYSDQPTLGLDEGSNPHRFYQRLFSVDAFASALRHVSFLAMFDDHEIENNYSGGPDTPLYRLKVDTWRSWAALQNPPAWYEGADAHGFALRIGAVNLAVVDTRTHRGTRDGLFGAAQRTVLHRWVRAASDALAASRVPREVPILASPSVVMPIHYKRGREGWWDHPGEYQRVVDIWRAQGNESDLPLVFASGDIHTAEITESKQRGRRSLLEFVSSPIMSFPLLARFVRGRESHSLSRSHNTIPVTQVCRRVVHREAHRARSRVRVGRVCARARRPLVSHQHHRGVEQCRRRRGERQDRHVRVGLDEFSNISPFTTIAAARMNFAELLTVWPFVAFTVLVAIGVVFVANKNLTLVALVALVLFATNPNASGELHKSRAALSNYAWLDSPLGSVGWSTPLKCSQTALGKRCAPDTVVVAALNRHVSLSVGSGAFGGVDWDDVSAQLSRLGASARTAWAQVRAGVTSATAFVRKSLQPSYAGKKAEL